MIGQEKFKHYLNSWNNPPQFIILQGDMGSGRSTLINLIKVKFKYNFVICGTTIEEVREIINLAYRLSEPTFYVFYNGDKLSNSAKNALLKIVEEPPKNAYFIMRVENAILDTLKNRAFYYDMQSYTKKELQSYFEEQHKGELFNTYGLICKNIGQIKIFLTSPYETIIDYCNTIITMITKVVQGNIFNITNKLNLGEEIEKWDTTLFLNILEWTFLKEYLKIKNDNYFQAIYKIINLRKNLKVVGANKQHLFDNFFLDLRETL